jgi:chaperonin GroEL
MRLPLTSYSELFSICRVSANDHSEIPHIVSKALQTVGLNGSIEIEESPSGQNKLELVEGLIFDRGFVSEEFLAKGQTDIELVFPIILVLGNKITTVKEIVPLLELARK